MNDLPEVRRADCCGRGVGTLFTSECVRMLSTALGSAVALDAAAVDRCAGATARVYAGCDWVGPTAVPVPPECRGLVQGLLASGAACRSSLECKPGLLCRGVGPTQAGACAEPMPVGAACARAVDTLATYTRQELDESHPECAGYCERHQCASPVGLGKECTVNAQCGRGHHCRGGTCAEGGAAAVGEACVAGGCDTGLRCAGGRCAAPKPTGAECHAQAECLGACLILDAGLGVCGTDCTAH